MVMDTARASLRGVGEVIKGYFSPILAAWWDNPLLIRARSQSKMPFEVLRLIVPISAGLLALIAIVAWVLTLRSIGAILMAISVGGVGLPLLIAPFLSADWTARRMQSEDDPRTRLDLDPVDAAWGLMLVMLWRFRWLLVIALILTPALIIGMLHVRVSDYQVWQQSAEVLGAARSLAREEFLTDEGGIPYFRLIVQAISAPLMLWALLPLMTSLGNTAALVLDDPILSDLAALIGGGVVAGLLLLLWELLVRTPALGGLLELVRFVLVLVLAVAILYIAMWVISLNASLIAAARAVESEMEQDAE